MPIVVGSNIASLRAQRFLAEATNRVSGSLNRLSSGLRINTAADDPAGVGVSSALQSQSRILAQGARNVNDAISMISIADSALQELGNIMGRLKELANQASNGTFSTAQRNALDTEAQALRQEFNRIVSSTKFNGITLLSGSANGTVIEGGGPGNRIQLSLPSLFSTISTTTINPLVGNGDGTFNDSGDLGGTPHLAVSKVFGDFDGDTYTDILVNSADGGGNPRRLVLYSGNSDGTFKAPTSMATGYTSTADASIIGGNIIGDSSLDAIAYIAGETHVKVMTGNGDGTFKAGVSYQINASSIITAGDVNNDGVTDIIGYANTGDLFVLVGNSGGSFKAAVSYSAIITPNSSIAKVRIEDVNGDNRDDVVVAVENAFDRPVSVLLSNSDGSLNAAVTYGANAIEVRDFNLVDFDNDSDLDIVGIGGSQLTIWLNNNDGTFKAPTSSTLTMAAQYGANDGIGVLDFDGDGILDVAFADSNTAKLKILLGNGDGTFKAGASNDATSSPATIDLYDINGDGVTDIITNGWNNGTNSQIRVYLGNEGSGSGSSTTTTYTEFPTFSLLTQASALTAISTFDSVSSALEIYIGSVGAQETVLQVHHETLEAIRSATMIAYERIVSIDAAEEVSNLLRDKILQQSAIAVLAQANQQSQRVLQLLS